MTVEEAIAILNQQRHDGCHEWEYDSKSWVVIGDYEHPEQVLTEFEAIAVAEKYQRGDRPNTWGAVISAT